MSGALMWTGLLMGIAGGPHCIAMCAAACAALRHPSGSPAGTASKTVVLVQKSQWQHLKQAAPTARELLFQLGRLLGYAAVGAVVTTLVQSLAWLSTHSAALRPAWTVFHLLILAWGMALLVLARQPAWMNAAARSVWLRVRPLTQRNHGVFALGMLWALMPCGLLYSALVVAGLSGHWLLGAGVMAAFGMGSALSLMLGPWLWRTLSQQAQAWQQNLGTRLTGLVLCVLAGWALWMDVYHRVAPWC